MRVLVSPLVQLEVITASETAVTGLTGEWLLARMFPIVARQFIGASELPCAVGELADIRLLTYNGHTLHITKFFLLDVNKGCLKGGILTCMCPNVGLEV